MHTKEKPLETLTVLNIFFLLAYFYFEKKGILTAALIFTMVSLLIPAFLKIIHKGWTKIFALLGAVNSMILLAVVYFVFLIPISALQKLFSRKKEKTTGDNYVTRQYTFSSKDFETMG
jgi:hypothetical protein